MIEILTFGLAEGVDEADFLAADWAAQTDVAPVHVQDHPWLVAGANVTGRPGLGSTEARGDGHDLTVADVPTEQGPVEGGLGLRIAGHYLPVDQRAGLVIGHGGLRADSPRPARRQVESRMDRPAQIVSRELPKRRKNGPAQRGRISSPVLSTTQSVRSFSRGGHSMLAIAARTVIRPCRENQSRNVV